MYDTDRVFLLHLTNQERFLKVRRGVTDEPEAGAHTWEELGLQTMHLSTKAGVQQAPQLLDAKVQMAWRSPLLSPSHARLYHSKDPTLIP